MKNWVEFEDIKNRWMQDEEFRKAYQELDSVRLNNNEVETSYLFDDLSSGCYSREDA